MPQRPAAEGQRRARPSEGSAAASSTSTALPAAGGRCEERPSSASKRARSCVQPGRRGRSWLACCLGGRETLVKGSKKNVVVCVRECVLNALRLAASVGNLMMVVIERTRVAEAIEAEGALRGRGTRRRQGGGQHRSALATLAWVLQGRRSASLDGAHLHARAARRGGIVVNPPSSAPSLPDHHLSFAFTKLLLLSCGVRVVFQMQHEERGPMWPWGVSVRTATPPRL